MVRINWTFQAKNDLKAIAEYIARDSRYYAKMQIIRIRNRTKIIKKYPRIGRIVPEIDNEIIRELIEGNYRIIYKIISDNQIDILTIHHSARDLGKKNIK